MSKPKPPVFHIPVGRHRHNGAVVCSKTTRTKPHSSRVARYDAQ